ncbi:MAG: hypothetical protein ACJ768_22390 [Gaiellaceae bacterium]
MLLTAGLIGSTYYWVFVASITASFAVVDFEALRRRSMSRMHGAAVAIYCLAWVVVAGLGLPIAPLGALWWVFPAAVRIAVAVAFVGGDLLAEAAREEQKLAHPELRDPPYPKHKLTAEELREAQGYDERWQREDRARNHRWEEEEQHRR